MENGVSKHGTHVTYSGREYDPWNFHADVVDIGDIAHHLSLVNRYAGATTVGVSVAQHSAVLSMVAPVLAAQHSPCTQVYLDNVARVALMHDAEEAYVGELLTCIKVGLGDAWKRLTDPIQQTIFRAYGLAPEDISLIHYADRKILINEMEAFYTTGCPESLDRMYGGRVEALRMLPMTPREAEAMFLSRFRQLFGHRREARTHG